MATKKTLDTSDQEGPETKQKYWFAAKKYGWGWSTPVSWEGWAVLFAYAVVVFVTVSWFMSLDEEQMRQNFWLFVGLILLDAFVLAKVASRHGPPPKWRWGDKSSDEKEEDKKDS